MKELNKYILVIMNPESKIEEVLKNINNAYSYAYGCLPVYGSNGDCLDIKKHSINCIDDAVADYAYSCYPLNTHAFTETLEIIFGRIMTRLEIYFKLTGFKLEDYIKEIEKINNKEIISRISSDIGDLKNLAFYCDAGIGWVLCLGQELSRTTYSALFAKIGTDYGAGDGSTTFNLPKCNYNYVYAIKYL
tara:strand:- start:70 stop:639 length:570 start_codon:yes stop_codon:yes gene_type:complete